LQLMLKPSQGPSRSGAQASFGTRAGATTGMGGVATTTGADMDPTPIITSLSVDPVTMVDMMVVLAIMVDMVVPVIMVDMVVTADPLIAAVN
jgi:hypothetical protein